MKELAKIIGTKIKTITTTIIKWRYLVALIVFVFCVVFQIHGSSINEYNKMFANSQKYDAESIIFGKSQAIRSDEWLVSTPNFMSQTYNDFSRESDVMSLSGQDMSITINAPVLDITILARPFMWGYVLLGNEYGLSWYWCAKVILLMLVSFEFCMILTQKNKRVSLLGMLLLTFAPAMQWWSIFDVYTWGMALFVLGYYFFTTKGWLRNLCTIFLPFAAIAFVLIFYPAFQIPTGMFVLTLLVATLIRDKKEITFKKIDILKIAAIAIVFLSILTYIIIASLNGITIIMGTSYPGAITTLGGDNEIKDLFTDLTSFTLPFKKISYSNNSEISTFIQFAPIFLMLYPVIYKKAKKNRNIIVGNALVASLTVMAIFMLIGFPELLAKITLFSRITRMKLTYGFAATVFTVWGIDMVWRKKIISKKNIVITLATYVALYICFIEANELSYLDFWQYGIIIIGLAFVVYTILSKHVELSSLGIISLMIICGMTVNPVVHGAAAVFDHPLEQKISEISREDRDAYWLAIGDSKLASLAIVNGAKALNMVNVYPDFKKWELIDPEEEYKDIYNRYAHIWVNFTEEKTNINLGPTRDVVDLKLNCEDALKWPAKYLITAGELGHCESNYQEIYKDGEGEYYIYERLYK